MHFRISRTMDAEDIFRCSIGCEIMLMIKARIRLIFLRYTCLSNAPQSFALRNWLYHSASSRDSETLLLSGPYAKLFRNVFNVALIIISYIICGFKI